MSAPHDEDAADLNPTFAEGYKLGDKMTVDEYARLDENDESLKKWKASLGISAGAAGSGTGPNVTILSLFLTSPTLPNGKTIEMDLTDPAKVAAFKNPPFTIKEGVEYNVGIRFRVNHDFITGLRYIHVVKVAGLTVSRMEQMIGSYGPKPDGTPHESNFPPDESPSGFVARAATYNVRSRIVDDDAQVHADFEWSFKLEKHW